MTEGYETVRIEELPTDERPTYLLKPKDDLTPREVLDLMLRLMVQQTSSVPVDGEVTVHVSDEFLAHFPAPMARHFDPE